jgi:hypothetical protein
MGLVLEDSRNYRDNETREEHIGEGSKPSQYHGKRHGAFVFDTTVVVDEPVSVLVPVPVLRTCASAARWSLAPGRRFGVRMGATSCDALELGSPGVESMPVEKGSAPKLSFILPLCELCVGWRVSESAPV